MIRFDIPAYTNAMSAFADSLVSGVAALDPLVGQIARRRTIHAGPNRNVPGPNPVDHPLTHFRQEIALHEDVIRNSELENFTWTLFQLAEAHQGEVARALLRVLREVTEATGNSVAGRGHQISLDLVLDVLDRVEIDFDEEGQPIMPTFWGAPGFVTLMAKLEPTPEQDQRLEEILRRQKARHDAQKRTRRLSE